MVACTSVDSFTIPPEESDEEHIWQQQVQFWSDMEDTSKWSELLGDTIKALQKTDPSVVAETWKQVMSVNFDANTRS